MDDDTVSDSPGDTLELSLEQQKSHLQSYLDSLPYECESCEDMQAKLEDIVGKIFICAKAKNWLVLTTWDGMLQCWLLMRYPMDKSIRAKLVRLYYGLCITPGIEPRVIRSWADMITRLLSNKSGMKRKLEYGDLELPWEPLWHSVQTHLWHKARVHDSSRSTLSLLLYVAEHCNRYFSRQDIPNMLSTFLPLVTKETYLVMIPILTSFLPPSHSHLYLPPLFKFWEAINSALVDDRLLHMSGELSEEHVAGPFGLAGEDGGAKWKDVGIWTQSEWNMLVGKGLASMNVPVGATRGASTTAGQADTLADKHSFKIKKVVDRYHSLAKIFVYSICVDGPMRQSFNGQQGPSQSCPIGFVAGSKALESLERLITSTESFFHPSNSGPWTIALTTFLHRLTSEFAKRLKQEEKSDCKTPVTQRLTPNISRAFVSILRTPAFLALFSKDPICVGFAQGALRGMALLEPALIMPELLERVYGGLEVVNETHRTTAVLSMLSGIARPLVTESIWLGGQKHLLPLLELCLPGIDLNDPSKTVCTTMFIVAAIQHVKIGDLSIHQSGVPLTDDILGDEMMNLDQDDTRFPDGVESPTPVLSKGDERSLTRDSTAAFADWVTSLFRRVIALYENLPEEGGKRNTTGGKQEESVLKSVKAMMDVVCLHLSDQLFDLILNLVFDYATTNAKSNAVRAFGQLVACLARVRAEQTLAKFLPFCLSQIEDELHHGASSIRTTAPTAAVPSDTTFHWHVAILRGCLGYGGSVVLKHRDRILGLIVLLIDKAKSERGYSSAGRLIGRILHTLVGVYPVNSRFVNADEWASSDFESDHNVHWGKLYEARDVSIEWHVPSNDEIDFVLEILDKVASPLLDNIEKLLQTTKNWDSSNRNDFCRYLNASRAIWGGLPTFLQEQEKEVTNSCINDDIECQELLVGKLDMKAGFVLCDPSDPRYRKAAAHRIRFGEISRRAALTLRENTEGEDHIDAVSVVVKAIDSYLLDYGLSKEGYESVQKSYATARDGIRVWNGQKENSRSVFVKRAQMYHCGRVYMHALYRRRSRLDDELIQELIEMALSRYTRVRRQAQAVLHSAFGYYVRSTRFTLPSLFAALTKGNDPDRMKGALYVLWNKGIASYALGDQGAHGRYLVSLLECQHEEKPSIQKLVNNLAVDCLPHLHEDAIHTDAYSLDVPEVECALNNLATEFSPSFVDQRLLQEAISKTPRRVANRNEIHAQTVSSILEIALRPQTHWRYVQMACRFLVVLLRRDTPVSADVARFFYKYSTSPQPTIRVEAQRGIAYLLTYVKFRSFSDDASDLWLHRWKNPLAQSINVTDAPNLLERFEHPIDQTSDPIYVDKIRTGFIAWAPTVQGYRAVTTDISAFAWEAASQPSLRVIREGVTTEKYFQDLSVLWGQESNRNGSTIDLRLENVAYIKRLAKMFEHEVVDAILSVMDPLLSDSDKFKQRAGGEFLTGLIRGAKHWPKHASDKLWTWVRSRLDRIFAEIKPDTLTLWETSFASILEDRDPRRNKPLIDWILSLPLDFNGDSAFDMSKALSLFGILADSAEHVFQRRADHFISFFFTNANTNYAEIRGLITQVLTTLLNMQWRPLYASTELFLHACQESDDPLFIHQARFQNQITNILAQLPQWREQRLPPPWVSKSEYDKVALSLLQWIWVSSYSPQATLVLPYAVALMPEFLRMTEFNDNVELQTYSTAVLYVLSAFTPPVEYIGAILTNFVVAIKSSKSWRIRLQALPPLVVFFYRNLLSISPEGVAGVMDMLVDCLGDENVEVREMASKSLSGIVRCSQRQSIIPLKNRFITMTRRVKLPPRRDPSYADSLRSMHSAILGLCALIESFPYSVEPWLPSLTEVLAPHATDPPPISTTIRKCASEFKKTHQDTWHKDQQAFDEDQLQSLSTMLVGTSYYA